MKTRIDTIGKVLLMDTVEATASTSNLIGGSHPIDKLVLVGIFL